MTRLRVGCVGTGFIAGKHLAALSSFPDVEVVAVADTVPERAAEVAGRYGARAYDDGLALLATEDLDAVWLCVPPFAHGPLEHAAIDRDLPFFVEKPLALDLATAKGVARRVRERRLLTAVGYHWRHLDVVERARAVLAGAAPHLVTGSWLDKTPGAPWWSRRAGSGGQVIEQTTHVLDLARVLAGEVDTVSAVEVTRPREAFPGADVPVCSAVTVRFASGAVGSVFSTCALEWRHAVGIQVVADSLVVELAERALDDHELRVVTRDGARVETSAQDPVAREDRELLDAVRGGSRGVRVPYDEALRTHALACASDLSAREGRPVKLDEVAARG